jgi:ATP-binding cassette subfamily B protein
VTTDDEEQAKRRVPPREELRAAVRGLGLVLRSSPPLAFGLLVVTLAQGAAPAVVVDQTGRFLRAMPEAVRLGADSVAGREVRAAVVVMAAAVLISQILAPVGQAVLYGLQRRFEAYLARRLMAATIALPGLAWFEDPDFRDDLQVSHWIGFGPVHTLGSVTNAVQQLSQVAAMAAVAASYAGWVPARIIAPCLPGAWATWRFQAVVGLARWRGSTDSRRADYYRDLSILRESGKELRVFRLAGWVRGRQEDHWLASVRELWRARHRSLVVLLALHVVALAALAFAFVVMLAAAIARRTDVGTFTAASTAAIGLLAAVMALFKEAGNARRNSFYLPPAVKILDLAKTEPRLEVRPRSETAAAGGTAPAERGIRFEGVTFAYPGTTRPVLDGLDLWVPAGSSLAIVGENGAGKTTLIKLLARFYDPTEGSIRLDGVDLRDLDLDRLRARLAVIFQDFVRYQLPARDNVGFGAVAHVGFGAVAHVGFGAVAHVGFGAVGRAVDRGLLEQAARSVGVLERIESLPQGWDTPLAREFGGVDLSGGEWQRVALARAVMARLGGGADVLALDEPTANLDVRVEHELYERFADLSRDCTTLLVSHRFSTVRMAERIVLLQDGRVGEDGSHEALVAAGGRYAELYDLQASHYRRTGTLE